MKTVVLRIEDTAPSRAGLVSLLEGARASQLLQLCQAGSAGLLKPAGSGQTLDRAQVHRGLVGLNPDQPEAQIGRWYAAAANAAVEPDETVWCCDFVTQQEGQIVDASAGRITTKEAQVLLQALDEHLGSDTRRWEVGEGNRHLFIAKTETFGGKAPRLGGPETVLNQEWPRALPRGAAGEALHALIEEALATLEAHAINRVRVDLGENPANAVWLWGASGDAAQAIPRKVASGVVLSNSFLLRGLSRVCGLGCRPMPALMDEAGCRSAAGETAKLLESGEPFVYLHVRVADTDPVERQCAVERLDQHLIKGITERFGRDPQFRFATVIDSRPKGAAAFVAMGAGLVHQPAAGLAMESLQSSPLVFDDSTQLQSWLNAVGKNP